jgi:YVTN family beta-propeller protein
MKYYSLLILAALLFTGCGKNDPEPVIPTVNKLENGMVVLCEGLFQHNNSTISWVNLLNGGQDASFFQTKTARSLGDTGNDMIRYGGKVYIAVNVSSSMEVMSANDFSPLKHIEMMHNGQPKQPRSMASANGYVYITCFDGYVDVLDTATLEITQRIPVGANPEGAAISNNKLYVANSGGLNFPNVDSTVSVIDLSSHTELQKITIGMNPGGVFANNAGEVFVISRGDYTTVPSRLRKIDATTDQLVNASYSFDISGMTALSNSDMIVYDEDNVYRFNFQSDQVEESYAINASAITTLYGVEYHPTDNTLYVLDAMEYTNQGMVHKYNLSGSFIKSYQVGLNPSKILFFD